MVQVYSRSAAVGFAASEAGQVHGEFRHPLVPRDVAAHRHYRSAGFYVCEYLESGKLEIIRPPPEGHAAQNSTDGTGTPAWHTHSRQPAVTENTSAISKAINAFSFQSVPQRSSRSSSYMGHRRLTLGGGSESKPRSKSHKAVNA